MVAFRAKFSKGEKDNVRRVARSRNAFRIVRGGRSERRSRPGRHGRRPAGPAFRHGGDLPRGRKESIRPSVAVARPLVKPRRTRTSASFAGASRPPGLVVQEEDVPRRNAPKRKEVIIIPSSSIFSYVKLDDTHLQKKVKELITGKYVSRKKMEIFAAFPECFPAAEQKPPRTQPAGPGASTSSHACLDT